VQTVGLRVQAAIERVDHAPVHRDAVGLDGLLQAHFAQRRESALAQRQVDAAALVQVLGADVVALLIQAHLEPALGHHQRRQAANEAAADDGDFLLLRRHFKKCRSHMAGKVTRPRGRLTFFCAGQQPFLFSFDVVSGCAHSFVGS